jgi:subtilase family serine protease
MRPINNKRTPRNFFEALEPRCVLSATLGTEVTPNLLVLSDATSSASIQGYTPAQIKAAYGFSSVTFGTVKGDGSGETIAIVDAYNDPNIVSDLAAFDKQFGLAAPPSLKVVNETGGTKLPTNSRDWATEIALDVEWAHAIAPGANILLVEASSAYSSDLDTALDYARNASGVVVVSSSWGGSEYRSEASEDVHFTTPAGHAGVTFTVAAGDDGTGAEYPASSPNVISVGGTSLRLTSSGTYSSESVWTDGGGGTSAFEGLPSYQSGLGLTTRGTPDVSYDANPNTGFAVYDSYGSSGWVEIGGTSAGAPQWAGLIAIVNQGRAIAGKSSLSNAQDALYSISRSDFHDVTSGSNGRSAASGYDLASGLGSPIANRVIADLVAYSGSTSFSVSTVTTTRRNNFFGFGFFDDPAGNGAAAQATGIDDGTLAADDSFEGSAAAATGDESAPPQFADAESDATSNIADADNSPVISHSSRRHWAADNSSNTPDSIAAIDNYFAEFASGASSVV